MSLYIPQSTRNAKKENLNSVQSVRNTKKEGLYPVRADESKGFGFSKFGIGKFGETDKKARIYKKKV